MAESRTSAENIENMSLAAGRLCLNFANTANWPASDSPAEYLTQYADLLTFGRRTGTLSEAAANQLAQAAAQQPAAAARTLAEALTLREALYDIFSSVALQTAPAAGLDALNRFLSGALAHARLAAGEEHLVWGWEESEALDQMLWPVVRSAADLLTSEELNRVGQCADDRGCGWLFLDMSRNRSRRWCDMKDCGNRAKARRHYHKQRAARS